MPTAPRLCATKRASFARRLAEPRKIEGLDILQKLDESGHAVVSRGLTFLGARRSGIAHRAGGRKVLRHPAEAGWTASPEPGEVGFHRGALRGKILQRVAPYEIGAEIEHQRRL